MVPPPDEAFDRAAILRRRAAFIASTLSTLSAAAISPGSAQAQDAGQAATCQREREDPRAAAKLTLEAKELSEQGKHVEAAALLERIYRMVPAWPVAQQRMEALAQAGDLDNAYRAGVEHLECVGESAEIRAQLAALELRGGRLIVTVRPPFGNHVIEVDGVPYDVARMEKGILLSAGKHAIVLQGDRGGARRDAELLVGQTVTVELLGEPPMPCLSVCLSYSEPRPQVRLGAGPVGPIVGIVPDNPTQVVAGGGARAAISAVIVKQLWFEGDVFGAALANDVSGFVLVGTIAELRYQASDVYSLGVGFSAGYVFALADDPDYLQSSPFLGPVLVPASFKVGPANIDIRIPCWFSRTEQEGVSAFRVGLVAPHVAVTFGGTVHERED